MSLHSFNAFRFRQDKLLTRELVLLRAERNHLVQMLSLCSQPFERATVEALGEIVDKQWNQTFNSIRS